MKAVTLIVLLIHAAFGLKNHTGSYYYNESIYDTPQYVKCCLPASPVQIVDLGGSYTVNFTWQASQICKDAGFTESIFATTGYTILTNLTSSTGETYLLSAWWRESDRLGGGPPFPFRFTLRESSNPLECLVDMIGSAGLMKVGSALALLLMFILL